MSDAIREAFEAWFSGWGRTPKAVIESLREGEEYPQESMREVNAAWHAWQAALSANGGEAVPYGYLREVDGRVQLSVGPECPPNRSGGIATPWAPIFDHPAPPSVAVPEGWDDDAAKQLEQARQLQEAQYGSSAQTLTAAPSPDHIADAGKVDGVDGWPGSITRSQAIKILDRATDKDDPHWEFVVDDFYDEDSDTMPSIFHVFAAIGVTEEEYREAAGVQNIDWPASATPSVPENEIKALALEEYAYQLDAVFANAQEAGATDCPAWHAGQFAKDARKQAARLRTAGDEGVA